MGRTATHPGAPPRTFDALNRLFTLRLLEDDAGLAEALEVADRLAVLEHRNPEQEVYLESLSMLLERYEASRHGIDTSDLDPVATLKFLVELHGISPAGPGAAVLRGERPLTKAIVLKFSAYFGVGPGVFLAD